MKKIILSGLSLTLGVVLFSSFEYGVYTAGAGDCTGANGSTGSCSSSSCHFSSGLNDLNVSIIVTEASNGNVVTNSYVPDGYYKITVKGTHGAGGVFPVYGLQFTAGNANDGQFTLVNNTLKSVVIPPYEYIEHRASVAAVNNMFETYFLWKAPPPGAGTITFYCTLLAGNGDHSVNGDIDKNSSVVFTENTMSLSDLNGIGNVKAFPNPATDNINLMADVKELGNYSLAVYNLSGQKIMTRLLHIQTSEYTMPLATAALGAGMYFLELRKGNRHKVIMFIKQ